MQSIRATRPTLFVDGIMVRLFFCSSINVILQIVVFASCGAVRL